MFWKDIPPWMSKLGMQCTLHTCMYVGIHFCYCIPSCCNAHLQKFNDVSAHLEHQDHIPELQMLITHIKSKLAFFPFSLSHI